jgi:ERCC4-related helicase
VSYTVGQQGKSQYNGKSISTQAQILAEEERKVLHLVLTKMNRIISIYWEFKKLEETLQKFRSGDLNTIVTSVLEEGMDVKKCNLVIRFDEIPEFRSYVQSKGRARAKPSKFIVMASSDEADKVRAKLKHFQVRFK